MRTLLLPLTLVAALPAAALADPIKSAQPTAPLEVSSPAFKDNAPIPADYTCEGAGTAPPLAWSRVPPATKSIAILVDDPDAPKGTFTHWLVTGIPPTTTSLDRGGELPAGAMASKNGKGETGYTAPCPPSGRHRYHFDVFALDIAKPPATSRADFLAAINGHIIAKGELVGTVQKPR
jgi:hypothetical protein